MTKLKMMILGQRGVVSLEDIFLLLAKQAVVENSDMYTPTFN
jgi:hypothetical protein